MEIGKNRKLQLGGAAWALGMVALVISLFLPKGGLRWVVLCVALVLLILALVTLVKARAEPD